jgi:UDP-N-acetylmuramyl pentapeptide synthase
MKSFLRSVYQSVIAWEASLFRNRYHGPVVAITGSVGKTSTKDAIAVVLRQKFGDRLLVTSKSLNSDIGLPLTLLGYKSEPSSPVAWVWAPIGGLFYALFARTPQCMVLELGADPPGDIAYLARLAQPTHAVITNAAEVHTAVLGPLKKIQQEKGSLLKFLSPDGTAILNGDDAYFARVSVAPGQTRILIRLHNRADYFMGRIRVTLDGTEGVLHRGNQTQRVRVGRFGEHHMYSVLFASAVADAFGIGLTEQAKAFKQLKASPGRGRMIPGKKGSYILDESYNASPSAMEASLRVLADLPAKKRIAVLGDMRELDDPEPAHRKIGNLAHEVSDYVIGVGPLSRDYKPNEWFATSSEATGSALRQLGPGVIVLVKGSQNTIRLERVVKALMLHPEQAKDLLVRQEPFWEHRP